MNAKAKAAVNIKTSKEQAEELKRRARRRLVGSVVLLLATFIIVPAVIETEPERAPSPIELVIPGEPAPWEFDPKRDLSPEPLVSESSVSESSVSESVVSEEESPKSEFSSDSENLLSTSAENPQPPVAKAKSPFQNEAETPQLAQKPTTQSEGSTSVKQQTSTSLSASTTSLNNNVNSATTPVLPKQAPVSPNLEDPIEQFAQADVFWVQVVAVSDKARASQLSETLKEKGFEARVESAGTDMGLVYRVRVGPIVGEKQAQGIKGKLQVAGYSGRIVQ